MAPRSRAPEPADGPALAQVATGVNAGVLRWRKNKRWEWQLYLSDTYTHTLYIKTNSDIKHGFLVDLAADRSVVSAAYLGFLVVGSSPVFAFADHAS